MFYVSKEGLSGFTELSKIVLWIIDFRIQSRCMVDLVYTYFGFHTK